MGSWELPFPKAEEVYEERVPSRLPERERLIESVLGRLQECGCHPDLFFDRLCLDEAISNAMIHGNHEDPERMVQVRVFCSSRQWGVEISDEGDGFDWKSEIQRAGEGRDIEKPSGRGIALLLASGAEVHFLEGGRRLLICRER